MALALWLLIGMTGMLLELRACFLAPASYEQANPIREYLRSESPVVAFLGLCFTGLLVSLLGPVQLLIIASERWLEPGNDENCNKKEDSKVDNGTSNGAST